MSNTGKGPIRRKSPHADRYVYIQKRYQNGYDEVAE